MHGGTIDGQSEGQGKGAVFIVRLPIAENSLQEDEPSVKRVVVVDDNPDRS